VEPVVSLIQARMSSARLPGKVLRPLAGASVLEHVVARAREFSTQVAVCTSTDPSDAPVVDLCGTLGVVCVRGSLDDVFSRYRQALADERLEPTAWFARVTADCPLISTRLALGLIEMIDDDLDYLSLDPRSVARGVAIELVRRSTFEKLDAGALDAAEREHVTLHLYETPGRFACRIATPTGPLARAELRLCIDYEEDYELLATLFEQVPQCTAEAAADFLARHPEIARINAQCRQKPARMEREP
jgi:spore coat polysaccharide biosynthesis protein SpsF